MSIVFSLFLTALVLFAFEFTKWALAVLLALVLWLFPTALLVCLVVFATMGFVGLIVNRRR